MPACMVTDTRATLTLEAVLGAGILKQILRCSWLFGVVQKFRLILCSFFLLSSHCRRGSGPPVCCLPDPPLSLSHEEKGWRQLRPWEETDLQESPYKWVLCLKLSSTLCPSRDEQTVWKHCALSWDVLNKCSFGIEFQSNFEKKQTSYMILPILLS